MFSLIVGAAAGRAVGAPAVLSGTVGIGMGGLGAAEAVAAGTVGGFGAAGGNVAVGGFGAGGGACRGEVGAAETTAAVGGAGMVGGNGIVGAPLDGATIGTSLALRVTRTVSFLRGMLDVRFNGF